MQYGLAGGWARVDVGTEQPELGEGEQEGYSLDEGKIDPLCWGGEDEETVGVVDKTRPIHDWGLGTDRGALFY